MAKDKTVQNQQVNEQQQENEELKNNQGPTQAETQIIDDVPPYSLDFDEFPPRDLYGKLTIPQEFVYGGTVKQLYDFLDNNPDLTEKERAYIQGRIQNELYFLDYENKKFKKEPQPPAFNGGVIKLENIHQAGYQSTGNGCYSASLELLLQSRGVNLDQKMIRAYRPTNDNDIDSKDRMLKDNTSNVKLLSGLVTRTMPNTAMVTVEYNSMGAILTEQELDDKAADIRGTIISALQDKKSPVSLLFSGHYRTITGYDSYKDEIIFKDSYQHYNRPQDDYDADLRMSITKLSQIPNINMTYIVDINPENPMENLSDIDSLEYVDGRYVVSDEKIHGYQPDSMDKDGMILDRNVCINGNTAQRKNISVAVPYSFVPTPEMQRGEIEYPTTKKLAESPEKQQLMKDINAKLEELFPKGAKLSFAEKVKGRDYDVEHCSITVTLKDGTTLKRTGADFAKYICIKNIASQIDRLTPWQTDHALDENRVSVQSEDKLLTTDFKNTVKSAIGKKTTIDILETVYKINTVSGSAADTHKNKDIFDLAKTRQQLHRELSSNRNNKELVIEIGAQIKTVDELLVEKGITSSKEIDVLVELKDKYKGPKDKLVKFAANPKNLEWYAKDNNIEKVNDYSELTNFLDRVRDKKINTESLNVIDLAKMRQKMMNLLNTPGKDNINTLSNEDAQLFSDVMSKVNIGLMDKGLTSSAAIPDLLAANDKFEKTNPGKFKEYMENPANVEAFVNNHKRTEETFAKENNMQQPQLQGPSIHQ